MTEALAQLALITPVVGDAPAFAPALADACAAGEVAAVILRLAPADERSLIKAVKALASPVQDGGAALVVALSGDADPVTVAARGGADGVHVGPDAAAVRALAERLKGERSLGAGGIRSRDEAMGLGEAGADYLLFGEPRGDGSLPPWPAALERAAWWAEIFETPCILYAPSLDAVPAAAATGAEFIALGDAVWRHPDGAAAAVAQARRALAGAPKAVAP
jgi:thiamine-phosphate pyrophosphorylase